MLIFYTGSDSPNGVQTLSEKSLGGYISSTIIPNGLLNNIFSTVTQSDIESNTKIVRIIVLKNLTSNVVNSVTIYPIVDSNSLINIKLGVATPFYDNCGNEYYERLQNENSLPYMTTFNSYSQDSPLVFSQGLEPNKSIAIMLLREINQENFPDIVTVDTTNPDSIKDLANKIQQYQNLSGDYEFSLSINW